MGVGGRELPVVLDEAVVVLQNARGADVLTGVAHPGTRAVPDQVVVVAVVASVAPAVVIAVAPGVTVAITPPANVAIVPGEVVPVVVSIPVAAEVVEVAP